MQTCSFYFDGAAVTLLVIQHQERIKFKDKTLELESQFQQSSLSGKKNLKYLHANGTVKSFLGLDRLILLFILEQIPTLVSREQVIQTRLTCLSGPTLLSQDDLGRFPGQWHPRHPTAAITNDRAQWRSAEFGWTFHPRTQPGRGLIWSVMEADRGRNWSKPISVSLSHLMSHCKTSTKPWLRYCWPCWTLWR